MSSNTCHSQSIFVLLKMPANCNDDTKEKEWIKSKSTRSSVYLVAKKYIDVCWKTNNENHHKFSMQSANNNWILLFTKSSNIWKRCTITLVFTWKNICIFVIIIEYDWFSIRFFPLNCTPLCLYHTFDSIKTVANEQIN